MLKLALPGAILLLTASPALAQSTWTNGDLNVNIEGRAGTPPAVTTTPSATTTTDASATVGTGGTFQQIAAANTSRKSFEFSNICSVSGNCVAATDNCYVFFGANGSATKANSRLISPGGGYLRSSGTIPSDAIQITCDGTADKFQAAVQ